MTYMLGFRYSRKSLALAIENMNRIIKETSAKYILIEHHFTRDLKYKERIAEVYKVCRGERRRGDNCGGIPWAQYRAAGSEKKGALRKTIKVAPSPFIESTEHKKNLFRKRRGY